MWLSVPKVFRPAYRDHIMIFQCAINQRHRVRNRESVAIQEHQQITVCGINAYIGGKEVQLAWMRANCRNYPVKLLVIFLRDTLKACVQPKWLGYVLL